ncbi:MAG: PD-(D/E)XK nuclease domain-containing protein [Verrucomicrobia bacterium]|nr:PD-(D/E)XK nuclease domain-containing protein [Verrucomicrobiota bacterium]
MDLVLELPKLNYIVEIKFNRSAKSALKQIEEKEYYQPFTQAGKKIRLLGISFTRKTKTKSGKTSCFAVNIESHLLSDL